MQKQKINLLTYLVIQSTYDDIQVALFNKDNLVSKKKISKNHASKDLILSIDSLLKENDFSINDLPFIVVNQGPGPFTTLRVAISTINALNFNGNLPLIGIDGLDAMLNEYANENDNVTVTLLNAYNNDVYYGIKDNSKIEKGWNNIEIFISELKEKFTEKHSIKFIGNGIDLFKNEIKNNFGKSAIIDELYPKFATIEQIAKMGYQKWLEKKDISETLSPIYLKGAVKYKA